MSSFNLLSGQRWSPIETALLIMLKPVNGHTRALSRCTHVVQFLQSDLKKHSQTSAQTHKHKHRRICRWITFCQSLRIELCVCLCVCVCVTDCWLNYRVWCALCSLIVLDVMAPVVAEHYKLRYLHHPLCTALKLPLSPAWHFTIYNNHICCWTALTSHHTFRPTLTPIYSFNIQCAIYQIHTLLTPICCRRQIPQPDHYPGRSIQPPPLLPLCPFHTHSPNLQPLAWEAAGPHWWMTSSVCDMSYRARSQGCSGLQTYSMLMTPRKSQAIGCLPRYHGNKKDLLMMIGVI